MGCWLAVAWGIDGMQRKHTVLVVTLLQQSPSRDVCPSLEQSWEHSQPLKKGTPLPLAPCKPPSFKPANQTMLEPLALGLSAPGFSHADSLGHGPKCLSMSLWMHFPNKERSSLKCFSEQKCLSLSSLIMYLPAAYHVGTFSSNFGLCVI